MQAVERQCEILFIMKSGPSGLRSQREGRTPATVDSKARVLVHDNLGFAAVTDQPWRKLYRVFTVQYI